MLLSQRIVFIKTSLCSCGGTYWSLTQIFGLQHNLIRAQFLINFTESQAESHKAIHKETGWNMVKKGKRVRHINKERPLIKDL